MKYCSECGAALSPQWVLIDGRERRACTECETVHYQNPRIVVSCAVTCDDSLLLCLRAREPARGKWELPSGFLECGETLRAGAVREVFEETGAVLDPRELDLYSITDIPLIEQVAITFRVELSARPDIRPNAESSEVAFVPLREITLDRLAWSESMRDQTAKLLRELQTRSFSIHLNSIDARIDAPATWREYIIDPTRRRGGNG